MNLQENIHRIKEMMGLITEQNDVMSDYVTDPRLVSILRNIEQTIGEKFTDVHFDKEMKYFMTPLKGRGPIQFPIKEAGGLLPEVVTAFNKMKSESGCPDIFIKENGISYRNWEQQKDQFLQEAKKYTTDKINNIQKRAAIPGFSQHHTGKAIDYGGNTICLRKNAWPDGDYTKPNKWGFILPFLSTNQIGRDPEPWHLYYVGVSGSTTQTPKQQAPSNGVISVTGTDLTSFGNNIAAKTSGMTLDLSSIAFDMDKLTFSVNPGKTPVYKIVLRWNLATDGEICQSCENTINKNPDYRPQVLKNVKWAGGTRIANLIALYPPK